MRIVLRCCQGAAVVGGGRGTVPGPRSASGETLLTPRPLFLWRRSVLLENDNGAIRASHPGAMGSAAGAARPAVRCDTALGLVFVNVDGHAPPLREWLGDLLVTLEEHLPWLDGDDLCATKHTKEYRIDANWKLLVENFLEYYHLPSVRGPAWRVPRRPLFRWRWLGRLRIFRLPLWHGRRLTGATRQSRP